MYCMYTFDLLFVITEIHYVASTASKSQLHGNSKSQNSIFTLLRYRKTNKLHEYLKSKVIINVSKIIEQGKTTENLMR